MKTHKISVGVKDSVVKTGAQAPDPLSVGRASPEPGSGGVPGGDGQYKKGRDCTQTSRVRVLSSRPLDESVVSFQPYKDKGCIQS